MERGAPAPIVTEGASIMMEDYFCLLVPICEVQVLIFFPHNISYEMAYTTIVVIHDHKRHGVN